MLLPILRCLPHGQRFLVVVNASNREKLLPHFDAVKVAGDLTVKIEDETLKTAMIAIQGPKVIDMVATVSKEVPALKRYRFTIKNMVVFKLNTSATTPYKMGANTVPISLLV